MPLFIEKIISFFIGIFTLTYYNYVIRGTHVEMVKDDAKYHNLPIQYISYSDFKKLFDTIDWIKIKYYDSLKGRYSNENYFHADIIKINNVGCVLTSYGLIRANMLKKKKINELTSL